MIRNLTKYLLALTTALIIFSAVTPSTKDVPKDLAHHVVPFRLAIRGNNRYATGFHLNYRGKVFIITNKHVCDSHMRIYKHLSIQFGDYVGEILAVDEAHDLCLVSSNRTEGLSLANRQSKPLEKVTVIGFPRGMGKVIREGRVIGDVPLFAPWLNNMTVDSIQISAIAYGGNSGSPILNQNGDVTGVLFAGHMYFHTETYIVPLDNLKIFLALNAR